MNEYIDSFDVNGDQYDLRDSNAISTLPQTLTSAQQQQARTNIGAAGASEMNTELNKKVPKDTASSVTFGMGYDSGGLYVIA